MVTKSKGKQRKTHKKSNILSLRCTFLVHAQRIKSALRSMVDLAARRSMVDNEFQTPSTVLPLTGGGGGGSDMENKEHAKING
jgi:hypothetical protein